MQEPAPPIPLKPPRTRRRRPPEEQASANGDIPIGKPKVKKLRIALVMLVLGALNFDSDRGRLLLVFGLALGSLGGLDTAVREHFAGFRSHTTVLSALPAVVTAAALFFVGVPWIVLVAAAALVFAAAFWALLKAYRRGR
jgi:hypothetical protein